MKKEHIILILFPLIWGFYFIFMKGQIGFREETDFFMWGSHYFRGFVWKPGGWTEYIGHFLVQFYQWRWFGALLMTLVPLGTYLLTRGVVRKLGLPETWLVLSCVPAILISSLQCYSGIVFGEILKIFFFFLFLRIYVGISLPRVRYVIFSLAFPVLFLILSTCGHILLYLSFLVFELSRAKGWCGRGIGLVWVLFAAIYPYLWRRSMYILSEGSLYTFSESHGGTAFQLIVWLLSLYGLILLGLVPIARRIKRTGKTVAYSVQLTVIGLVWAGCFCYFYQSETEHLFRIDQAAQCSEWEEVLSLSRKTDQPAREEMYLTALALACRGQLADKLFDYPVWGTGCLYLPRELNYKTSVLGGEFYYRMNMPNEAIHWIFQASVASAQGMNFRCLKRLIDLNILKGDEAVAEKYLAILERSSLYGEWCRSRRAGLKDSAALRVLPQQGNDFFIGARPFLSDMARILDAGKGGHLTLDYILCGLLLNKDLGKFCQIFTGFYPYNAGDRIPAAYEQALLVAMTLGREDVVEKNYGFTSESMEVYQNFNVLFSVCDKNKERAKKDMQQFRNTWWYYFHFVEMKPMDEQGHLLDLRSGYSS